MGRVYKSVDLGCVWLGDDPTGSAKALFTFQEIIYGEITTTDGIWKPAIIELIKFPWFHRVWVMQEAVLSRNTIGFWGSGYSASLSNLEWSFFRAICFSDIALEQVQTIAWLKSSRSEIAEGGFDVFEVLEWVRS
jgi:hypothetical protein